MRKWIRPAGVLYLIIFLVVTVVLGWVGLDWIAKKSIESIGTNLVDGKVDVRKAHVSFKPFGLEIQKLEITDIDRPMRNAIEIDRVAFLCDGAQLLQKRFIVKELTADGVRFNTPRRSSGFVPKPTQPSMAKKLWKKAAPYVMPSLNLPDAATVLKQEPLDTVVAIETCQKNINEVQENWVKLQASLPGEKNVDGYREQATLAISGNIDIKEIPDRLARLQAVQKQVAQDADKLNKAQAALNQQAGQAIADASKLPGMPAQDVKRIVSKYAGLAANSGKMTQTLLQGNIVQFNSKTVYWYGKLAPYYQRYSAYKAKAALSTPVRGSGINVEFAEWHPMPKFWIQKASVALVLPQGRIGGEIRDVAAQQYLTGKPTTLTLRGAGLKGLDLLEATAYFNQVNPAARKAGLVLKARGWGVQNWAVVDSPDFPVKVASAVSNVDAQFEYSSAQVLATLHGDLNKIQMADAMKQTANDWVPSLATAIEKMPQVFATVKIQGPVENLNYDVASNLDQVLSQVVGEKAKAAAEGFRKQIEAAVAAQTAGPLAEVEKQKQVLVDAQKMVADRVASAAAVGKDVDQKIAELKKQADDAQNAIKREAEAKAAKAADDARQNAQRELQKALPPVKLPF